MNPHLYLHELVRTVPGREEAYLASVLSLAHDPTRAHPGHPAFAQFRAVPTSGPWPLAVNIWENTWAGQAADLMGQFLDTGRDTVMEDWWNRNLHLRRGGYDRLLVPAPYSPTLVELLERGVTGEVFWQDIVWLPFGEPRRYLEVLERDLLPGLDDLGLVLVGAFRVAMRPRQVLTVIGARDWSGLAALVGGAAREPSLRRWHEYRAATVQRAEDMLLLPARHGPLVSRPPRA